MAASFKIGQTVKVNAPAPQGVVQKLVVDDDGNLQYLVEWVDGDGGVHQRWFTEEQLAGA